MHLIFRSFIYVPHNQAAALTMSDRTAFIQINDCLAFGANNNEFAVFRIRCCLHRTRDKTKILA